MNVDVLLGLQWGDEGKGKIVDVLTPHYDIIARFQGGPNAGHTLEFEGIKHVLHTIPSGIFHESVINVIGNGVVIDPVVFNQELEKLTPFNMDVKKRLLISKKAHLIVPTHKLLDAATELSKGTKKIGSTLKGIGDDAAILDFADKKIVVSTDLLIEGVHFDLAYMPLKHLGYKAVVANVSDICAMNAKATQITVSVAVSNRFPLEALEELFDGITVASQ